MIRRKKWICCTAVMAIAGSILLQSARSKPNITHYVDYEVKSGDTLWSIARSTYNDSVDVRDMIDIIKDVNSIEDYKIYPGTRLSLPMSDRIANKL